MQYSFNESIYSAILKKIKEIEKYVFVILTDNCYEIII